MPRRKDRILSKNESERPKQAKPKDNMTRSRGSKEFLSGSLSSVSSARGGGVINTMTSWGLEMAELRNRPGGLWGERLLTLRWRTKKMRLEVRSERPWSV